MHLILKKFTYLTNILINFEGTRNILALAGDSIPSVDYAKRIADALGVSLDYLVSDNDKEDVLDNDAVKRIKEIQGLPDSEKDKIYSVVDALIRDYKTKKAYT
ncbi:helix-turn-helix domain-containing protein [Aquimarina algiphila]|uniref:helix-turn-helix domain-containing protein n=1 Tax=Aquimarina algiphila TaxID=2047982 RepID=UPI00232CD3EB|nr:hypothetical protein [Aquimarina algiphila]